MTDKTRKWPWRWLAYSLVVALLVLFGHTGQQIYTYGSVSTEASADAAIVLGAAVWEDQPSPVFAERINHAVHLYQQARVQVIIFTGGRGLGDSQSEAEVAKDYALQRGVLAEHIYCESSSQVTYDNLRGARHIMAGLGLGDALLVSDPLHMRRSMLMAEDLGLSVHSSPTPTSRYETWRSKLGFLARETRLYVSYLLRRSWMKHKESVTEQKPVILGKRARQNCTA
jgi:uncharacterized SAM-binding protein YcdF (DUF218 family)